MNHTFLVLSTKKNTMAFFGEAGGYLVVEQSKTHFVGRPNPRLRLPIVVVVVVIVVAVVVV